MKILNFKTINFSDNCKITSSSCSGKDSVKKCDFSLFPDMLSEMGNRLRNRGKYLCSIFSPGIESSDISAFKGLISFTKYDNGSFQIKENKPYSYDYILYRFNSDSELEYIISHDAERYIDTNFDFSNGKLKYNN